MVVILSRSQWRHGNDIVCLTFKSDRRLERAPMGAVWIASAVYVLIFPVVVDEWRSITWINIHIYTAHKKFMNTSTSAESVTSFILEGRYLENQAL